MRELKATTAQEIVREEKDCDYMDELFGGVKIPPTQVYIKSEADAVIADLEESHKKEVEQLLIEIVKLNEGSQNLILDDCLKAEKVRHSNYKRCLAMADMCAARAAVSYGVHWNERKSAIYSKWADRWLIFAEKFKEEKKILELVENFKEAK